MRSFRFTKMHGLGNNYIYVNQMEEQLPEEQLASIAKSVSNINTGIGSDGLILITTSDIAPVKMRIFNSDGSEGTNCGNGLRCVAKYSYESGLVRDTKFLIDTLSGPVKAILTVDEFNKVTQITIDMGKPRFESNEIPYAKEVNSPILNENFLYDQKTYEFSLVSMGNPHAVTVVDEIDLAPVTTVGPYIEKHELFTSGVNVEFIQIVNENELHFRVWERGSGITQACGTGACAAAVVSILKGFCNKGEEITVHLLGGDLIIIWDEFDHVWMKGPAKTICEGVYYFKED